MVKRNKILIQILIIIEKIVTIQILIVIEKIVIIVEVIIMILLIH